MTRLTQLDYLTASAAYLIAALLPSAWRDQVQRKTEAKVRKSVLDAAADKLDHQAQAHGESVVDYSDLLRIWADNHKRWETGR